LRSDPGIIGTKYPWIVRASGAPNTAELPAGRATEEAA
jgi:hypothetical protein